MGLQDLGGPRALGAGTSFRALFSLRPGRALGPFLAPADDLVALLAGLQGFISLLHVIQHTVLRLEAPGEPNRRTCIRDRRSEGEDRDDNYQQHYAKLFLESTPSRELRRGVFLPQSRTLGQERPRCASGRAPALPEAAARPYPKSAAHRSRGQPWRFVDPPEE